MGTLEKCLGVDIPPDRAKIASWLATRAMLEVPLRPSCVLEELATWLPRLPVHLQPLLPVTFFLGQRASDVLMLRPQCLSVISSLGPRAEEFLAITFLEGKVVGKTGPYTLHCRKDSVVGRALTTAAAAATLKGWEFLFVPPDSDREEQRAALHAEIQRDVRCLRRGGLQRRALMGLPFSSILVFYRHACENTLRKYLEMGRSLMHQAALTSQIIDESAGEWTSFLGGAERRFGEYTPGNPGRTGSR